MAGSVERVPFRQTSASVAMDAARGVAALLVLVDHCHNLFFLPFGQAMSLTSHPRVTYLLYALTSAGREAVVIFFVLSGFLISGSVFRALEQGRWSWKEYLTHRMVRLWLVLLPALGLCAVWDVARLALTGAAHGAGGLGAAMAADGLTLKNFFGNIFFLQSIRVPTFGSDRVLWSLAFEFWYYMLFPLGLLALRRGTTSRMRLLYGAGFVLAAVIAGRAALGLFPVWLCGTALTMLKPPNVGRVVRWVALLVFAPCPFVLAMTPWTSRIVKMDYVLGLLTTAFLWVMLSGRRRVNEDTPVVRVSRSLAGSSYSLYLVHYPLLAFVAAAIGANGGWPPRAGYVWLVAGFGSIAVAYGYAVAACTEWHNDAVRRWVEERLGVKVRPREPLTAR